MKKLLIATTALVGTAGVAAADITFSGYGRFGILYEEDRSRAATAAETASGISSSGEPLNADGTVGLEETRLESRYRLNIDSSTETDGGIRFAARIRVEANDNSNGGANAGAFSGARFQVNVGGFRVRVGNISGVHDAAEVVDFFGYEPGLIGQVGHYSTFAGGIGNFGGLPAFSSTGPGANGINVKYEAGAFAVMASYTEDLDENDGSTVVDDFQSFEIGASYTFGAWTLGAAYGNFDAGKQTCTACDATLADADADAWTLTASGAIGVADVAFFVGDTDIDGDSTAYGISGSIPVGASTNIVASYAGGGDDDLVDDAYGVGFTHSLGGGVSLSGMVGVNNADNTVADLGVRFNF